MELEFAVQSHTTSVSIRGLRYAQIRVSHQQSTEHSPCLFLVYVSPSNDDMVLTLDMRGQKCCTLILPETSALTPCSLKRWHSLNLVYIRFFYFSDIIHIHLPINPRWDIINS